MPNLGKRSPAQAADRNPPPQGSWPQASTPPVPQRSQLRFRRLSKDNEFLAATSETVIYLAMIQILTRRLANK